MWTLWLLTIKTFRCVVLKSEGKGRQSPWARFHFLKANSEPAGLAAVPRGQGVPLTLPPKCPGRASGCGAPRLRMFPEELAEASLNRNRITCFINVLIKLKCIYYFLLFLVE